MTEAAKKRRMKIYDEVYPIDYLNYNNCEILEVTPMGNSNEYIIKMKIWVGLIVFYQTLNCTELTYDPSIVSKIGETVYNEKEFIFKAISTDETILRICADKIFIVDADDSEMTKNEMMIHRQMLMRDTYTLVVSEKDFSF